MHTPATARVPATGPRRRLQALRRLGWTNAQLAYMTQLDPATIQTVLRPATVTVNNNTATRIRVIFDRYWNQPPKPRTRAEQRAAESGVVYAIEQGWAPAMAWDDIDNPEEEPQGIPTGNVTVIPVAEALDLLKAGVAPFEVAQRFNVKPESLARRLRRHGQHRWAAACERKGM